MSTSSAPSIDTSAGSLPDYLEPFIVEQDPSRYSAVDQAVWRFVLLQLHARLQHTAHPSYVRGLAESGISAEHIPSVGQMNQCLGAIGWRAVCVDGFIPPRAFQAFQALGILPIAAEIRSVEHLPYTPAPDIIHEAAGHAPILIDPRYAAFVREAGRVALRAFANPADARVDRAVRLASDLAESGRALPDDLRAARHELTEAIAALGPPSEAAKVARLYWWTAEYGLVGSPKDYRLYGAGLLSSLGESHFCHRPEVAKLPLSAACVDVGYDITRPQPQLFVARDFEQLHAVLAEVARGLSYAQGGIAALRMALASGELCTVALTGGLEVIGTLAELIERPEGLLLCFAPGAALIEGGRLCARVPGPYLVPVGLLEGGSDPRRSEARPSGAVRFAFGSGLTASGFATELPAGASGHWLWLRDFRLEGLDGPAFFQSGPYPLPLSACALGAGAGSTCAAVSPLGESTRHAAATRLRVPKERSISPAQRWLEELYRSVAGFAGNPPELRRSKVAAVAAELDVNLPHEWLLRWNLLECLTDLGEADGELGRRLRARLLELEKH
ncbi:MAG TPA: aromatic amino acid hydroxylase, partial [Polyangiaceae bacterium]|nr:aromatic amino acid hydroxylase [Polyangiaceae bacterium]